MNLSHEVMMIILAILTILDITTRGIPITRSNFTFLNVGFIFTIILEILDIATKRKYTTYIATKGKYRTRHLALMIFVIGLILSTIYVVIYSNF